MQTKKVPSFFTLSKEKRILLKYKTPERAKAFRKLLEELGPAFVKLGQYLAQREDILPEEYIKELILLQDHVGTIPFDEIYKIIYDELDGKFHNIFKSIEREPIASASISQVHSAELVNGDKVAVKVMKPATRKIIEQDISLIIEIARNIDHNILKHSKISILEIITNLSRSLERETDFLIEASHIEQFYQYYQKKDSSQEIIIPKVYWEATTNNIITMEKLIGHKIEDIYNRSDKEFLETSAKKIIKFCYDQIFNLCIVHADLHKGNIRINDKGQIIIYDFGQTYLLSKNIIIGFIDILNNIEQKNYERVVKTLLSLSEHKNKIPAKDLQYMIEDTKDIILKYYNIPLKRINVGILIKKIFEKYRNYHVSIPTQILMLTKALSYLEITVKQLGPDLNVFLYARQYINRYFYSMVNADNFKSMVFNNSLDFRRILQLVPGSLEGLFKFLMDINSFTKIFSDEIYDFNITFRRTITSLCLSIIVASLVISSSFLIRGSLTEISVGFPYIGFIGYILAFVFSVILIIFLIKSNK